MTRDLFEEPDYHAEAWAEIERDARRAHAELEASFPEFVRSRWEDLTDQSRDAFLAHALEAIRIGGFAQT